MASNRPSRSLFASLPLLPALASAALTLLPSPALACAACACGDPTLTTFGAEQPFAGRLRVASLVRAWGYTDTATQTELGELRLDLAAAWSPLDWLTLTAQLPLQGRRGFGPTTGQSLGVGDVTLAGRVMLWRDSPFASRWMIEALVGSVLPTAVGHSDGLLVPATSPLSLGEGAFSPLAGLSVLTLQGPWSAYASATGAVSFGAGAAGPALRTSLFGQRQLWPFLALRLGAEARFDSPLAATASQASSPPTLERLGQHAHGMVLKPTHAGHAHPDGSRPAGMLSFAALDALFSLSTDTQLQVGVRVPVVTLGSDRPWPIVQAGFVADL